MQNIMQIEFSSRFSEIIDKNKSFAMGKLLIAYTGLNRNNTFISKESFEKAIPSMYNCPIVAKYTRDTDEIEEHSGEWVDKNGKRVYVNTTHPVGVVPESAEYEWVEIEDNGAMHEYIMVDALLWKRQEAYEKIKANGITSQSMEINVKTGKFVNGYYEIDDFEFTAFCLLGTAEPCFESASLFTFSSDDEKNQFVNEFKEMMDELKFSYSSNKEKAKEEKAVMDFIDKLLQKYNLTMDDITEDIDGLSEAEVEAKFVEIKKNKDKDDDYASIEEPKPEPEEPEEGEDDSDNEEETPDDSESGDGNRDSSDEEDEVTDPEGSGEDVGEESTELPVESTEPTEPDVDAGETDGGEDVSDVSGEDNTDSSDEGSEETFRLISDDIDALRKIIYEREIIVHEQGTEWEWEEYKYYFRDLDPEAGLVYYETWEEDFGYIVYSAPYTMNGDMPVVDFEAEKRQKRIYVDFDEGATETFSAVNPANDYIQIINNLISVNAELNQYKMMHIEAEKQNLFNSFDEKLNNNTEYKALKENAGNYDIAALEKELFALFGKVQMEFSRNIEKSNSVLLYKPETETENEKSNRYGGLFEKYGFKKENKEEK